jgi:hypothetical protein
VDSYTNDPTEESNLAKKLQAKKQRDIDQNSSTFFASASAEFGGIYQYTDDSSNFVINMDLPG